MTRKRNAAANEQRQYFCEALMEVLRCHPDGISSADAGKAIGITKGLASTLLTHLSRQRKIGQRFARGPQGNWLAYWMPDPSKERPINPTTRRAPGLIAPNFTPYEDFDASHEQWVQSISSRKPMFNPCGRI